MLRTTRHNTAQNRQIGNIPTGTAPLRRPGAVDLQGGGYQPADTSARRYQPGARMSASMSVLHPLCRTDENMRLRSYEDEIKQAFDYIVPTLKKISAIQHENDFEAQAQRIAREGLGFELPDEILADAWVEQLDMRRLFAWCVFSTYRRFCDEFFAADTLVGLVTEDVDSLLQSCGFHTLDISPCADGRLAHLVRYVLRLDPRAVRRKSYAGAMFDVEDSIQKWMEIELQRFREGRPNTADAATRYLKVAAYHYSSGNPEHEGCAAHGSDTDKAAQAALDRLTAFRQAIENSFCCGASIDVLLIGVDTDIDSIRVHVPDANGQIELDRYLDTQTIYAETTRLDAAAALRSIEASIRECAETVSDGMAKFISRLVENNLSQIDYVMANHGERYPDIGHAERFIGAGIGFEDIQLRNLMYFAYLDTVEEGAADLDVGIKIFRGLNVSHGLPVPVVVRFDYHGDVPGARERAEQRCGRVAQAMSERYEELYDQGLLHILQVARDCDGNGPLEIFACSVNTIEAGSH
jgi:carboxysome shell carbonic anhydrase